jgi:hypothetical protein
MFFELSKTSIVHLFLKLANSLLKQLVLLLSVLRVIACCAIAVTNFCFRWCNVLINEMFNTRFGAQADFS